MSRARDTTVPRSPPNRTRRRVRGRARRPRTPTWPRPRPPSRPICVAAAGRARRAASTRSRRVQADFENYRKRVLREQTALVERATERLVEDLLPVLDTFDGALGSLGRRRLARGREGAQGRRVGIRTQLVSVLETAGPRAHRGRRRAVRPERARGRDAGRRRRRAARRATMLRTGYRLKGRVLRPAMVQRARARADADGAAAGVVREGLLRRARRVVGRVREGDHARLPEAREAVPPRREPRRHGRRGALQGDLRRVRRARRRREAQGVRRGPRDGRVRRRARRSGRLRRRRVRAGSVASAATSGSRTSATAATSASCFGNLFGGAAAVGAVATRARSGPQRGHDLETELHLDFLDAVHGVTTSVNITSEAPCSRVQRHRREAGHVPRALPHVQRRAARSRSTRARSRSRRCAPRAAGAAASSRTSARTARAAGVEVRPAHGEGAHPGRASTTASASG